MPALAIGELRGSATGESSATVAARVLDARGRQAHRLGEGRTNSTLRPVEIETHCEPDAAGRRLLEAAFDRLGLSARSLHRVLRVARTLADLEGAGRLAARHVAEAVQYRTLDRPGS